MTDLEHIRAKFAAEYGLSEDMLRNAERWTETTGDLEGVPENLLPGILGMRFGAIAIDTPRSERWSTPEDIDVIADLAYLPDGGYDTAAGACRGHLLDLYLPHDAVLRGGHTLPVYIDIHGGGFTYGYKELNRNFNVHLAEQGFAVFCIELSSGAADRLAWAIGRYPGGIALDRSPYGRLSGQSERGVPHRRFRRWRVDATDLGH